MPALVPTGQSRTLDRQVVRLGATGSKNDAPCCRSQKPGYLLSRFLHRSVRLISDPVNARRISMQLAEVGQHRLQYFLVDRGRCIVVEVDDAVENRGTLVNGRDRPNVRTLLFEVFARGNSFIA